MNRKPALSAKLICLGVLAVLLLAAALCLLFVPGAPRHAASGPAEGQTLLTIYEGPRTMTGSQTAVIRANGHELFVYRRTEGTFCIYGALIGENGCFHDHHRRQDGP